MTVALAEYSRILLIEETQNNFVLTKVLKHNEKLHRNRKRWRPYEEP